MTKIISTVEEVREYIQKDYWVSGKSKNKSGYEQFHIDWTWNGKLVQHLISAWPDIKRHKVLDLGCAYGQVVACLYKNGINAYGIDISDFAVQQGQKEYKPLKARTRQGSCHDLSYYGANEFDFLYSQQVFEHIPKQYCEQLAKETFRVAKKNAILWCGLVLDLNSDFQPQGHNPEDPDKTHINLRPRQWWDDIFTKAGWSKAYDEDEKFRKVKIDGYSFFEEYGWHSICYKKG